MDRWEPTSGDGARRAWRCGPRAGRDQLAVVAHRPLHTCTPGSLAAPHFPLMEASGGGYVSAMSTRVSTAHAGVNPITSTGQNCRKPPPRVSGAHKGEQWAMLTNPL